MRLAGAFRRTIAVESFTDERRSPEPVRSAPPSGARWGRPSAFEIGQASPRPPDPATITYSWLHEVVRQKGVESHRQYADAELGGELVPAEAIRSVTFYLGERQVRHERRNVEGGVTNVTPIIETIRHYVRFDFPFGLAGARGEPHPPPTPPREEPDHG